MVTKTTQGISVSVETLYRDKHSNPDNSFYLFSYFVAIKNETNVSVKLLRRKWEIYDSSGEYREVEGAGVVGEQPVLNPGERYTYESTCNFTTEIGKMRGSYFFEIVHTRKIISVEIPEFILIVPSRLN